MLSDENPDAVRRSIETSSFGTKGAKELRESTPDEAVARARLRRGAATDSDVDTADPAEVRGRHARRIPRERHHELAHRMRLGIVAAVVVAVVVAAFAMFFSPGEGSRNEPDVLIPAASSLPGPAPAPRPTDKPPAGPTDKPPAGPTGRDPGETNAPGPTAPAPPTRLPAPGMPFPSATQANPAVVEPVYLIPRADGATWRGPGGVLPFPGQDGDRHGYAYIVPAGTSLLEDGTSPEHLWTHPAWEIPGWIAGEFTLPTPIGEGQQHFRAKVGFQRSRGGPGRGDVTFIVQAVFADGSVSELARQRDVQSDGVMHDIDVDLSLRAPGMTRLILRVEAGASSEEDWAVWVGPRIEDIDR